MDIVFDRALDVTLSSASDATLIERGQDVFGDDVPVFLECLKRTAADCNELNLAHCQIVIIRHQAPVGN